MSRDADETLSNNPYETLSTEPHLELEAKKLRLLEATAKAFRGNEAVDAPIKKEPLIRRIFRKCLYYFLIVFGLLQDIAGNYLFSSTLFSIIPGIIQPAIIGLSVFYTLLDSILFYAFEVSFLKEGLGISSTNKHTSSLIDHYSQQLKLAIEINELLTSIKALDMDDETYKKQINLAILFNQDLKNKKEKMDKYHESIPKKILKYGVIGFGIISSVVSSYFIASTMLAAVYAPLLGTPIGWILILLTITAGLGFYYAMGARSMLHLVSPERPKFHALKAAFTQFKPKEAADFEHIEAIRAKCALKTIETATKEDITLTSPLPLLKLKRIQSVSNIYTLYGQSIFHHTKTDPSDKAADESSADATISASASPPDSNLSTLSA